MLLLFLLSGFTAAQNEDKQFDLPDIGKKNQYTVENITISDGLQDNNINDVLQDSHGFLWLASSSGLQKYDGYTFTSHVPDTSDPAWQNAYGLYENENKNLWIQMKTGFSRYCRKSDDFVKYYFVNGENDTLPYWVSTIAEDMKGTRRDFMKPGLPFRLVTSGSFYEITFKGISHP